VNQPTPAIVAQSAVRRLPRWSLLLLCLAYVVPGYVGRSPWRMADMEAFGYMRELALGHTSWLAPRMAGLLPESEGLLSYWLGALAMQYGTVFVAQIAMGANEVQTVRALQEAGVSGVEFVTLRAGGGVDGGGR